MKILLINHYAGNLTLGMEFRPYYLAKQWVKKGHEVTIVAASYSHLRKQQPVVDKNITVEFLDDIKYVWIKTPIYNNSGVHRFINVIAFVIKLFIFNNKLIKESYPDVVIASSTYPIDIYPAHRIAKKCNAKLCFELHDLWPLSPMEIGGYSKYHPFIMLMQAGENFACKKSEIVVSLLSNAKQYLIQHGMNPDKFHHIINGYDANEIGLAIDIPQEHRDLLTKQKEEGKMIICYAGGINEPYALHTLALAVQNLQNAVIVFVGKGNVLVKLKSITYNLNLNNVFFLPIIEKRAIPTLFKLVDIGYVGFKKSDIFKYGISPNKITDYMLAGKPIILSADVENEIVDRVSCGITVPAEDPDAVKNAILKLSNLSEEDRKKMGEKGREYALRELNYETLAQKFIQALGFYQ